MLAEEADVGKVRKVAVESSMSYFFLSKRFRTAFAELLSPQKTLNSRLVIFEEHVHGM